MADRTRPILALYVVWHPMFKEGSRMAEQLLVHYRRELYSNAGGSTGLSVQMRSALAPGEKVPIPIPLTDSETTIIVTLADPHLSNDPDWIAYIQDLSEQTDKIGFTTMTSSRKTRPRIM